MNFRKQLTAAAFLLPVLWSCNTANDKWVAEKHKGFTFYYTEKDKPSEKEYAALVDNGTGAVNAFFGNSYKNEFDVFVYPNRQLFDTALRRVFGKPDFKSECWLVATGDAYRINILSPGTWDQEHCESGYTTYSDRVKTQKLITHELVHVFHGQLNANPELNDSTGVDWFLEGLAFYASGQLDSLGIKEVKKAILDKTNPKTLDGLSTFDQVNLRYGISGSLVLYIDKKWGRAKLKELLPFNKKSAILATLSITEPELLSGWEDYMLKL